MIPVPKAKDWMTGAIQCPGVLPLFESLGMPTNPSEWASFARTCFPSLEAGFEDAFGSFEELIEFMLKEEEQELLALGLDSKLCQLVEIFPDVDVALMACICNSFPDDPLDQLTDMILAHTLGERRGGRKGKRYVKLDSEHARMESPQPSSPVHTFADAAMNGKTSPKSVFEFSFGEEYDGTMSIDELQQMAHDIQQQRRSLYHRAAEAFARGQLTGRHAASYYSQEARHLEPKLAKIMSQMARIHFNALNPDPKSLVIDLHGLSVSQACAVSSAFIKLHSKNARIIKLVTGIGRHSEGRGRLRPAVEGLIKSMGLHYESEDAAFRVYFKNQ